MKTIWFRLPGKPVPLDERPSMHDSGCTQRDARHWKVPWKGSGELRTRLEKAGVIVEEVDEPARDERQVHGSVFQMPDTVDLAELEKMEQERRRQWRGGSR